MARKKQKKVEVEEVKEEVLVIPKVNPLAVRYITLCKERTLNGLETSELSDTELKVLIKHLIR